jgi:hypothetical protein
MARALYILAVVIAAIYLVQDNEAHSVVRIYIFKIIYYSFLFEIISAF